MRNVVLAASLILLILVACTQASPTSMATPAVPFEESALAQQDDGLVTVIIGQVVEKTGEQEEPSPNSGIGCPCTVRYGFWRVKVERYIANPQPYEEITYKAIVETTRSDGTPAIRLGSQPPLPREGERTVFFLKRRITGLYPLLTGDTYGGFQAVKLIEDGLVDVASYGGQHDPEWVPLDEFVDSISALASQPAVPEQQESQATGPPLTATPPPQRPREITPLPANDPMARVAEQVPGFGGVFKNPILRIVYIYLQDASLQEEAERVLTEVLGPEFLAGSEIRVLEGEYTMAHLDKWYYRMRGISRQVLGISLTGVSERKNRIEIRMYPVRGAREKLEAALVMLDIPLGAVDIDVGCKDSSQWRYSPGEGEPPNEAFLRAIDYSLKVVSEASYGDTVQMKLTLRNVSNEPVNLFIGGTPAHDFVITTFDGEQIWRWMCARITLQALSGETLEPGEELAFTGEWEQVDNRGQPVPPGRYLVRGVLNMKSPKKLVTPEHELEVRR